MGTLMILALITAGVITVYLVEEWSGGGGTKTFASQNGEKIAIAVLLSAICVGTIYHFAGYFYPGLVIGGGILAVVSSYILTRKPTFRPSNITTSARERWTSVSRGRAGEIIMFLLLIIIMLLAWASANVPALSYVGIYYVGLSFLFIMLRLYEAEDPKKTALAVLDLGSLKKWKEGIGLGLPLGVGLFMFATSPGPCIPFQFFAGTSAFWGFFVAVLAIPFVEVGFFRGVVLPSLTEEMGIVVAIAVLAIVFAGFHFAVFGGSMAALAIAGTYSLFSSILVLHQRAIIGALVAHATYNTLGFLMTAGLLIPHLA